MEQGAEGRVLKGTFSGLPALAKVRFSKKYRHPSLDASLTSERTRAEVRSLVRCQQIPGVRTPTLYMVDTREAVIVMEYLVDAIRCRDYIDRLLLSGDDAELNRLMREIGKLIARIHRHNIIHGDLTTSNILVRPTTEDSPFQLYLIDFGLGYAEGRQAEDKGVDIYVFGTRFVEHASQYRTFLPSFTRSVSKRTFRRRGGRRRDERRGRRK